MPYLSKSGKYHGLRRSRCTMLSPALNCRRRLCRRSKPSHSAVRYTNPFFAAISTDISGVALDMGSAGSISKVLGVLLTEQQGRERLAEKSLGWNVRHQQSHITHSFPASSSCHDNPYIPVFRIRGSCSTMSHSHASEEGLSCAMLTFSEICAETWSAGTIQRCVAEQLC